MTTTSDIGLPLVAQQQAQPEVTHNEALIMLSALMKGVVTIQNAPPGSPAEGDSYIVGTSPTGAWSGRANTITIYTTGGWRFVPDRNSAGTIITMGARHEGMRIWRQSDDALYVWDGSAWNPFATAAQLPLDYGQRSVNLNTTVIAVTAAVDSTLATNTDYIQVTGIFNATPDGVNSGITQQTNSFTIDKAGVYRIEFWGNTKSNTNNTQIAFKFAIDGVLGTARRPKIFMRNTGEVHNGGAFGYAHFDAGDVITLWMASTVSADITIEDLVFGAMAIRYD